MSTHEEEFLQYLRATAPQELVTEPKTWPLAKRRMSRRRRPQRRTFKYSGRRKSRSALTTAKTALREVRRLAREEELKYLTAVAETAQIPIAGAAIVDGFGPYTVQGVSEQQRVGSKITVKSLSMRFNIKLGALEADGTSVRLMIVYDRVPASANATITNMLVWDDMLSPYNTSPPYRGRFQFLADKVITFDSLQGEWNDTFFLKKDMKVGYNGNAGTVADVEFGNFLVVGMSRGNAAAIDIDYMFRLVFTDA